MKNKQEKKHAPMMDPPPRKKQRTCDHRLPEIEGWKDTDVYRPLGREGPDKLQHLAVAHVMNRAWVYVIWKWNEDTSHEFSHVCATAMTREDAKKAMINACVDDEGYFFIDWTRECVRTFAPKPLFAEDLKELEREGYLMEREGDLAKMKDWGKKIHFIRKYLKADFCTDGAHGNLVIAHPELKWFYMISEVQMYSDVSDRD